MMEENNINIKYGQSLMGVKLSPVETVDIKGIRAELLLSDIKREGLKQFIDELARRVSPEDKNDYINDYYLGKPNEPTRDKESS